MTQTEKIIGSRRCVIGFREFNRVYNASIVEYVVLASDCDDAFSSRVKKMCEDNNLKLAGSYCKEELGRIAELNVPCGIISVLK